MFDLFASAFVTLFVVIAPPGCAPIYAGLTSGANLHQRRAMAIRASFIAPLILLGFALFGEGLLAALRTVRALTLAALLAAGWIVRLVGSSGESAVTRLLGVLLAALAAQYVVDGVRGSFG